MSKVTSAFLFWTKVILGRNIVEAYSQMAFFHPRHVTLILKYIFIWIASTSFKTTHQFRFYYIALITLDVNSVECSLL